VVCIKSDGIQEMFTVVCHKCFVFIMSSYIFMVTTHLESLEKSGTSILVGEIRKNQGRVREIGLPAVCCRSCYSHSKQHEYCNCYW